MFLHSSFGPHTMTEGPVDQSDWGCRDGLSLRSELRELRVFQRRQRPSGNEYTQWTCLDVTEALRKGIWTRLGCQGRRLPGGGVTWEESEWTVRVNQWKKRVGGRWSCRGSKQPSKGRVVGGCGACLVQSSWAGKHNTFKSLTMSHSEREVTGRREHTCNRDAWECFKWWRGKATGAGKVEGVDWKGNERRVRNKHRRETGGAEEGPLSQGLGGEGAKYTNKVRDIERVSLLTFLFRVKWNA